MSASSPKIWTITSNPALDDCRLAAGVRFVILGGGGINAARSIGPGSIATGFAGRPDLPWYNELAIYGVEPRFVPLDDPTRIQIFDPQNGEKARRQVIRNGFTASHSDLDRLIAVLTDPITGVQVGDPVIISGSLPRDLDATAYAELSAAIMACGGRVILDGPVRLEDVWILKQNWREFNGFAPGASPDDDDLFDHCRALRPAGITIVSLGPFGTFVAYRTGNRYRGLHLHGDLPGYVPVADRLGAGDVLTGQFAWEIAKSDDVESASTWAISAATSSIANPYPGVFDPILAGEIRPQVRVSFDRTDKLVCA